MIDDHIAKQHRQMQKTEFDNFCYEFPGSDHVIFQCDLQSYFKTPVLKVLFSVVTHFWWLEFQCRDKMTNDFTVYTT